MDYIVEQNCTRDEAISLIRKYKTGRTITACCDVRLPVGDGSTYFPGRAHVDMSWSQACKFVRDALSPTLEQRGGRIEIRVCDVLIFVG